MSAIPAEHPSGWTELLAELTPRQLEPVNIQDIAIPPFNPVIADGSDQTANIDRAISLEMGRRPRGIAIFFPDGEYGYNPIHPMIDVGPNYPVVLFGTTCGKVGGTSLKVGARIKSIGASLNPLVRAVGTSISNRAYVSILRLELHGGDKASDLVYLERVNELDFTQARLGHCTGSALHGSQVWNSAFSRCFFTNAGNGNTTPALLLDANNIPNGESVSNTVHFSSCEFEGNTGVDIRLTGNIPDNRACTIIEFTNTKMEDITAGRTWAYIDFDFADAVHFTNTIINSGGGATSTNKIITSRDYGSSTYRDIAFTNLSITHTGIPTEYITCDRGPRWHFDNVFMVATNAVVTNKNIVIKPNVAKTDFKIKNYTPTSQAVAIDDQRAGMNALLGSVRVPLDSISAGVTPGTYGNGAPKWDMSNTGGVFSIFAGNLTVPNDCANGRPPLIRVHWSSAITAGVMDFTANFRSIAAGVDVTGALTGINQLVAAPGSANAHMITDFQFAAGNPISPNDLIEVRLFRNKSGSDTLAGVASFLFAEFMYERQL